MKKWCIMYTLESVQISGRNGNTERTHKHRESKKGEEKKYGNWGNSKVNFQAKFTLMLIEVEIRSFFSRFTYFSFKWKEFLEIGKLIEAFRPLLNEI